MTKSLTSSSALCEENAEWIVEEFDSTLDFGTVDFTSATATTSADTAYTPAGAAIVETGSIEVTASASGVVIKYV